jgi:hypothetical protein
MKIVHRVSLTPNASQRRVLLSLGLRLIESESPLVRLVSFDVEEGEASWPKVKTLIDEWKPADFVRTEFSRSELEGASFLQLFAMHKGYPQPADDFGYLNATYDLSDYCQACGIGKTQVAPFRMKGEPHWGKNHVLQLNWVFDEFFVQPQVWEAVFRPTGVGRSVVLDHRTGKPLQNVVQLVIKDVAPSVLRIADYPCEVCPSCGCKKYLPISRGFFPPFETNPESQVCKTQEFFGSGGSGWNATVVGSDVYRAIQGHKIGGVAFVPLKW